MTNAVKITGWTLLLIVGVVSLIAWGVAPFVAMAIFSDQLKYQFAVAVANDANDAPQPAADPTQDVMAEYFPMPEVPPAPEPSFADLLHAILGNIRTPTANNDRQILAGTFRQAANLIKSTQIGSLDEATHFLAVNAKASLGHTFHDWEGFLSTWSQQVSALAASGSLDMNTLATVCSETAEILGSVAAVVIPAVDLVAEARKSRKLDPPPPAGQQAPRPLTTTQAVALSRTPDPVPVVQFQQPRTFVRRGFFRRR